MKIEFSEHDESGCRLVGQSGMPTIEAYLPFGGALCTDPGSGEYFADLDVAAIAERFSIGLSAVMEALVESRRTDVSEHEWAFRMVTINGPVRVVGHEGFGVLGSAEVVHVHSRRRIGEVQVLVIEPEPVGAADGVASVRFEWTL